jgi:SAM-dependent methyltransferase
MPDMTEFDSFAHDYDQALNRGLALSGEDKSYFADGRVRWLSRCLRRMSFTPAMVLDYGCGTGTATRFLLEHLGCRRVLGLDLSERSLDVARREHAGLPAEFRLAADYRPAGTIDLAFCNGVFHHIPPPDRPGAAGFIAACLRPGGLFAFWDNNPWNPGARWVMRRIEFDRDAQMLSAASARRLVESAGLRVMRTDYRFLFPRILSILRGIEPLVSRLPLGAQYQVLSCKDQRPGGDPAPLRTASRREEAPPPDCPPSPTRPHRLSCSLPW